MSINQLDWKPADGAIGRYVREVSDRTIGAYRAQPSLVEENANQEQDIARGGYARRQIVELVQNAADQLKKAGSGRIEIRLTSTDLYVADDGFPIDKPGARALMFSHLSPKHGTTQIGRFGVGFKSVLSVTDSPRVFSRSGSFIFDREYSARRIREVVPDASTFPVLRIAQPVDPYTAADSDHDIGSLMEWATNIVHLPLKDGAHETLDGQIREFRSEFLLFVPHVRELLYTSSVDNTLDRCIKLRESDGIHTVDDNSDSSRWMIFSCSHHLSPDARNERRTLDNADCVDITWAAPVDRISAHQHYWAYFPTETASLVRGIFNAPWKTNEDRQNLLSGSYNEELIDAAARLFADSLPCLHTDDDPAAHIDALGGRIPYSLNRFASRLSNAIYSELHSRRIIPDMDGTLRPLVDIAIPPDLGLYSQATAAAIDRWARYEHRPANWLHPSAISRERIAAIHRVHRKSGHQARVTLHKSLPEWLEALTEAGTAVGDPVRASITAIRIAAVVPKSVRRKSGVGAIVLTASHSWVEPEPDRVYLGEGTGTSTDMQVHSALQSDDATKEALVVLGIGQVSIDSQIRTLTSDLLMLAPEESAQDSRWHDFWTLTRQALPETIMDNLPDGNDTVVRVRTVAKTWEEVPCVLLPGPIVPSDGTRDAKVAVDMEYHARDKKLLERLNAVRQPTIGYGGRGSDRCYRQYVYRCRDQYCEEIRGKVDSTPHWPRLNFKSSRIVGPLDVFERLSQEGRACLTDSLIEVNGIDKNWVMAHDTQHKYPPIGFESLATWVLRKYGCIRTTDGFHALSDGLGESPANPDVQRCLLRHPATKRIRTLFPELKTNFAGEVSPEGDYEPVPLTDEWPGLSGLDGLDGELMLIRCDRLVMHDGRNAPTDCTRVHRDVYVVRQLDEGQELRSILLEIGVEVGERRFQQILRRETPRDIRARRDQVREKATEAERLLAAVGEEALLARLPASLVGVLGHRRESFAGVRVARAAIATFHTDALREYRHSMARLRPPRRWAGSRAAVAFVRALGFGIEWAGRRSRKPPAYEDIWGPYTLPPAHPYQAVAIANVRALLRTRTVGGENRGLLSLPTGSGKTRVAVEAIIEAIRCDGFAGTILWVADRGELCEQAVESWRQAWSAIGPEAGELRISRMWGGRRDPVVAEGTQVVVASRQTLAARGVIRPSDSPLNDVRLLVVDEAHGSIAPSYTSIMQALGLTFRRREDEICLLGLTATPYRGSDEVETARLVSRYGRNRLDSGAFGSDTPEAVIRELQDMNVLSRVDHRTIRGTELGLDDLGQDATQRMLNKKIPWLPESVERQIANDTARTQRIVDAYTTHVRRVDPACPTLIFATSVEHAETVAALLQLEGVEARAVSGKTDDSVRRGIVDRFRSGLISVLVNYGVFREGFDAPKTGTIIVARPVYSPNLYFQMIGRGLRGELNGGSESCLILDVEDNIENYDRALAYSELDWLWS